MKRTQPSKHKDNTLHEVDVDVWEERDRLSIVVTDPKTGGTIAEWWDDDARQMFEDGFFKSGGKLHQSVADYCQEHGLLDRAVAKVKHTGSGKRSSGPVTVARQFGGPPSRVGKKMSLAELSRQAPESISVALTNGEYRVNFRGGKEATAYYTSDPYDALATAQHMDRQRPAKVFSGKRIKDFQIKDHGVEHAQYFQGVGTYDSQWEDVATGVGENAKEAYEDAVEQLATSGWEVSTLPTRPKGITKESKVQRTGKGKYNDDEIHYYVSVYVE